MLQNYPLKIRDTNHQFYTPELPVWIDAGEIVVKNTLKRKDKDQREGAQDVNDT